MKTTKTDKAKKALAKAKEKINALMVTNPAQMLS